MRQEHVWLMYLIVVYVLYIASLPCVGAWGLVQSGDVAYTALLLVTSELWGRFRLVRGGGSTPKN